MNVFKPVVMAAVVAASLPMPGSAGVAIKITVPPHVVVGQMATITASVDSDHIDLLAESCFNHTLDGASMKRDEKTMHSELVLSVRGHNPGMCSLTFSAPRAPNATVSIAVAAK